MVVITRRKGEEVFVGERSDPTAVVRVLDIIPTTRVRIRIITNSTLNLMQPLA